MLENLTPKKAVEFAITTEALGEKFYNRLASKFSDDPHFVELFKRLAADEKSHQAQFTKLLETVEDVPEDKLDFERAQYLRAMSISEFFSKSGGPFKDADSIEQPADALEKVFGFEKSLVGFYQAIREVVGPNEALEAIIEAEKQHVVAVMKLMLTDAKYRSMQDPWA